MSGAPIWLASARQWAVRHAWLCPAFAVLLAALAFAAFGLSIWAAVLAAFFLVCPALLIWGALTVRRGRRPDAPRRFN